MDPAEGASTFHTTGDAYDAFMGRYSRALAPAFATMVGAVPGMRALDLGCGPGAFTTELVLRLGSDAVAACDPSPGFVETCAHRHPDVDVRAGRAESIPFDDASFDLAAAQLVLFFASDPAAATRELRRVVRPGGTIGACAWDSVNGMEMLRAFWDAALDLDPEAPDESGALRFGGVGEIAELFANADLTEIRETELEVHSTYTAFDELWSGFCAGIGPAGAYCVSLPSDHRDQLRERLFSRLGSPAGAFELRAVARSAVGTRPA